MALAKRERILLIVCGVVVVIAVIYQFVIYPASKKKDAATETAKPKTQTGQPAATQPQTQTTSAAASVPSTVPQVVIPVKEYKDWGRDPFSYSKSLNSAPPKPRPMPKHKLKGMLTKQGKTYVVIDDMVLSEGDEQNGLKVERIDESSVVCRERGRTFTLQL